MTEPNGPRSAYVEVAVAARIDRPLTYRWELDLEPRPGLRVAVPLRGREAIGFVVGEGAVAPEGIKIRRVARALDERPLFPPEMMELFQWLAAYYRHPLGQTIAAALPVGPGRPAGGPRRRKAARALPQAEPPRLPPVQARVCDYLAGKGWVPFNILRQVAPGADAAGRALVKKGLVEIAYHEPAWRPVVLDYDLGPPPEPTPEQAEALTEIRAALNSGRYTPFLLHGVTGSGKTEVYLRAGQTALDAGRTAIILVPEIALTPRLEALFRDRFGDMVAVLHSGLTSAQRLGQWLKLLDGRARIALGARSAVFAPLRDVGLIVVDEEHEPSYKQEEGLRYHARDVALVRGRAAGAVVVLGSATPSVVSYQHQKDGKYRRLSLTNRILERPLPEVEVVDLRDEPGAEAGPVILSRRLIEATRTALASGQQALYFLNRRGFATYPVCGRCGRPVNCPNCSVTLTFHQGYGALVCHYCGLAREFSECPKCGRDEYKLLGLGAERLDEETRRVFPRARVARLDSDVAGGLRAIEDTLTRLAGGEIDILVGTQMLAKGHDFPGIGLVGVVLADLGLSRPDFRAAERTFQLLTQVAGRAGRGETPGRVVIQTMNPDHYSLRAAASQDYAAFFDREAEIRRQLFYPPFSRLIQIRLSGRSPKRVELAARALADLARQAARSLSGAGRISILGPAPAPVLKVANRYRWLVLIKTQTAAAGQALLDRLLPLAETNEEVRGLDLRLDVDPMSMS